jgi:electron transfer flavoprotein beta subunit
MNLVVLLKMVPDTVEELEVAPEGKSLDASSLRFKLSDPDEHAFEQALLLKEKHGGTVTVLTFDAPEVDDVLFTALAKGADRAVKLPVEQATLGAVATARLLAESDLLKPTPDTLILAGSYAIDDLEGELAPFLAEHLRLPYLGVITSVSVAKGGQSVTVLKEFAGGLRGEFEVPVPAVLGIQAAEKPPRYVPVAKVRAAMKSAKIETPVVAEPEAPVAVAVERMYKPEVAGRAEMLEGSPEEVAARIVAVLAERGLV